MLEEPSEDAGDDAEPTPATGTSYRQSTPTYDDVRSSHRQRQGAKAAKRRARRQERKTRRDRISSAFGAMPLEMGRVVDDRKAYSRADYSRSRAREEGSPHRSSPSPTRASALRASKRPCGISMRDARCDPPHVRARPWERSLQ